VSGVARGGGHGPVWRALLLSQWLEHPARLAGLIGTIALGVALGATVYLINGAALNEFGLATKKLIGEADIVVRGPREGFSEALFTTLAHDPDVSAASPVLELEVALPGRRDPLKVIGLDPFRAAAVQSALIADLGRNVFALFRTDGIILSASAAHALALRAGDEFEVIVGNAPHSLHVLGTLSESAYSEPLGIMDIASAQWSFAQIGRLNRIDLRLRPGSNAETFRSALSLRLPPGVLAVAPDVERNRTVTVTRAYRINLNMLALVALWTGAFLVFSTQSLSVLRRRRTLGLLRALGATRGQIEFALVGEGALFGLAGSLLGVLLGEFAAAALTRMLIGDLGNGQLHAEGATLIGAPWAMLGFIFIGSAAASVGAWLPARSAAREPPARALKGGDADPGALVRTGWRAGVAMLAAGALLARLPPVAGLPLFGYAAVAALLFGAVLLVPMLTVRLLRLAPRVDHPVPDTALAQLRENVALSTLSLASIIVSFSLMVAMAIMVYSFRVSFEHWLGLLLPADLQMREPLGNDTAYWSPADQARLAAAAGVARIEFRRTRPLLLDPDRPPVILIARNASTAALIDALPLVRSLPPGDIGSGEPAWISEAFADLYGYRLADELSLPLAGRMQRFKVAGIWRDYARSFGAVAISRAAYVNATGDRNANEASIWLDGSTDAAAAEAALRACLERGNPPEILTSTALRERSLRIFDRAFAITYAIEAIAVIIGLTGISFTASSTALARRAEFGMLRHIGMLPRQILGMLGSEGVLLSAFGVVYGLVLGAALSLVLVYVVNRQSFNWSIDLAVPLWQLALLSVGLVAAAAVTAVISGRAALNADAVRAVREDW
jgi:putative ABC transport system permease protein